MTDAVTIALITSVFGAITTTVTTVGTIISRKARDAAREASKKVDEVHGQAVANWKVSHENQQRIEQVQRQTDGNVSKLHELWAEEARRRESVAWKVAFEAGRRAEMQKTRRATDPIPVPTNDEEPKE